MAILVDKNTRVICQGFTGKQGTYHSQQCLEYGTKLVGGVTPGRGGEAPRAPGIQYGARRGREDGRRGNHDLGAGPYAADAILEAADAGMALIVAITEGIPVNDMVKVKRRSRTRARDLKFPTARA